MRRLLHQLGCLLVLALVVFTPGLSFAQSTDQASADLQRLNTLAEQALTQAQAGDLTAAAATFEQFRSTWFEIEDGVRAVSRQSYKDIEDAMGDARYALSQQQQAEATAALQTLITANQTFIAGTYTPNSAAPSAQTYTLADLTAQLTAAQTALSSSDAASASAALAQFGLIWPEVEGLVKVRSASAYTSIENDMARASSLLSAGKLDEAQAVITGMSNTLAPITSGGSYGIFDAATILLREGLEAMLIIAALLTFLNRSGNRSKRGWIWAGSLLGIVASLLTAVVLTLVFQGIATGTNRELVEGITGLVAAGMLFYVSFWLHSKSHLGAWQQYIRDKTNAALKTGSLLSLATLAFLSVFREGAETALFYIGIAPSISMGDLLAGIGLAVGLLVLIGLFIFVLGARIPLRPFFLVTSILIFYLGFKFIGTGIHALQIAQVIPANVTSYLPSSEWLGLFPTWETTIPQLALLVIAACVIIILRRVQQQRQLSAPLAPAK